MKPGYPRPFLLVLGLAVLVLAGCNPAPAPSGDPVATIVALTQTAMASLAASPSPQPAATEPATSTSEPSISPTTEPSPTVTSTPQPSATPTPTPELDCTDQAKFVSETVPDGTIFATGQTFTKTWTLQNTGTCTWTKEYALVLAEGDAMGGQSPQSLPRNVPPDSSLELSVDLTAPEKPGSYQGDWILRDPSGKQFGLGKNADKSFWVKIEVAQSSTGLNLGTPTWVDSFEGDHHYWYLGADENVKFEIKDGNLVLTALTTSGDQWRVAQIHGLQNFYLEARFKTGTNCSGKDSYGLLVRAPDTNDNVVNSGYVFGVSCDGNFRYYRMDDGDYVGLQNWIPSANIHSGPNQTNVIGVKADEDSLALFINGLQVAEFRDATYSEGIFGLLVRSVATENFQVSVEQVAYWELP